jgi:hypothetical protein
MAPSDPPNDQRDSRAESPASTITGALPEITLGQKEKSGAVKEVVEARREWARGAVAIMIVGALLIVVLLSFGMIFSNRPTSDIKEIVELLIAPVIGIVGAVTGFYFGSSGVNANRGPEL